MNFDTNFVLIIAAVLAAGIYLGGKMVFGIMSAMKDIFRPNMPYNGGHYLPGEHITHSGAGTGGCFTTLLITLVIVIVLYNNLAGNKYLKGVLNSEKEVEPMFSSDTVTNSTANRPSPILATKIVDPSTSNVIDEETEEKDDEMEENGEEDEDNDDDDNVKYIIQLAALLNWENAMTEMKKLDNQGIKVGYFTKTNQEGQHLYILCAGPYPESTAEQVKKELKMPKSMILRADDARITDYQNL